MKKIIYALCLIASACSSSEKKAGEVAVVNLDAAETLDVNLSDLIEHVRIIPLETNEKCLIAHRNVCFADDFILVGTYAIGSGVQASYKLLRFDLNGKFSDEIGRVGKGPGEHFYSPRNIRYDRDRKLIEVGWGISQLFSLSGDFLQDIHQPPASLKFTERLNDSIWFGSSVALITPNTTIDSTMIYFFTSNGSVVKKVPREIKPLEPDAYGGMEPTPARYKFNGRWKYYTSETHTLSRIDHMNLVPEVVFESKDFLNLQTNKNSETIKGKINLLSISETDNYLLILRSKAYGSDRNERASDMPLIFVDKNSMQAANLRLNDDVFHLFPTIYFCENWIWKRGFPDGRFPFQDKLMCMIVDPDELISMLKNRSGEVTREIQAELDKLKNLKETDNPVIFLFTLKESIYKL